ncbi:MAG TPA: NAD(P)-dependent oxidoreductase [Gemmatimonadales bacterium]|jgi:3-hydroxyisobutyrate dehydrogenase
MIAFLGTGLLGTGFIRALRRRGESVHVWNRTASRAKALEATGAVAFDNAADAVRGADLVHICVSDDAAVDEVIEQLRPGLGRDVVVVDHTTTAPVPTADRTRRLIGEGIPFQHAPVFMGPANALNGTGSMMASGDRAIFDRVEGALQPMTGKVVYLGAEPGRAATFKLMGNLVLIFVSAGIADMFEVARAGGVSGEDAAHLLDWFNPAGGLLGRAERMLKGDLSDPSWTLEMARKDARLMIESAAAGNRPLAVLPSIAAEMDRWIAEGHAREDWMVIGAASRE